MRIRKLATLAVAVAVPVGMVVTLAGAGVASAGKPPPPTGTISCPAVATTATLSVPFVPGGTLAKKSATSLPGVSFGGCTGTGTTEVSGVSSATSIKTKYKPAQVINNCSTFISSPPTIGAFKLKIKWADRNSSSIVMTGGSSTVSPPGFLVTGSVVKGAFLGGTVSIQAVLDSPTLTAIGACIGGSPTPISSLGLTTSLSIS